MFILQCSCPNCSAKDVKVIDRYSTINNGMRNLYLCPNCSCRFSETKNTFLERLRKPISLVWQVVNARTEGVAFNATTRIFGISKNTLISWERKFSHLSQVLFLYAVSHSFLELVIEGDELYTKVKKTFQLMNPPVGQLY